MAYMIQGTPEPAAARRSERLVAALAPPSGSARLVRCAGRFLANGSQPARRGTPMPGARKPRTRRSHVVAAAHISQRCMRMASPRRVGRAHPPDSDGHPRATRRVKNRQSDDSGPCRRCAAALSIAADAPTYILLGSHAKSGQPMRRSPRRAVPFGRRKWRFAVGHGRHHSRSLAERQHPSRSSHERLEPSATAGDHRFANGWGLLRRGAWAYGEPRIGSSGQTGTCKRY